MKYLIFFISFLFILSACKKDEAPEPTPIPVDPPSVYVPIYQPGDTSMGAAYAKKLTASWKATSLCRVLSFFDTNYISIIFLTYNNFGEHRESFSFGFIPRFEGEKIYSLKHMASSTLQSGNVSPTYGTWTSDGDVLQDYYEIDTTAFDNHFTVTKLDLANKRIECTFTATFKIVEPRVYAANPKTVKFSNGWAWAYIRD
jgi:hypothetical protein